MEFNKQFDVDNINIDNLPKEDIIKLAYLLILGRKIDDNALASFREVIKNGNFNKNKVIEELFNSPEYAMRKILFYDVVHEGRQKWCKSLDKYSYILDIGGSSPNIPEGALIELGYQYRPKEIIIFDLPEEKQFWGKPKFPQDRDYKFDWGYITL